MKEIFFSHHLKQPLPISEQNMSKINLGFHSSHCPIRFHTVLMSWPCISGSSCKRFRRAPIAQHPFTMITSDTSDPTTTSSLQPLLGGVHRAIFRSAKTEIARWYHSHRSEVDALCIRLHEKCGGNTYTRGTILYLSRRHNAGKNWQNQDWIQESKVLIIIF